MANFFTSPSSGPPIWGFAPGAEQNYTNFMNMLGAGLGQTGGLQGPSQMQQYGADLFQSMMQSGLPGYQTGLGTLQGLAQTGGNVGADLSSLEQRIRQQLPTNMANATEALTARGLGSDVDLARTLYETTGKADVDVAAALAPYILQASQANAQNQLTAGTNLGQYSAIPANLALAGVNAGNTMRETADPRMAYLTSLLNAGMASAPQAYGPSPFSQGLNAAAQLLPWLFGGGQGGGLLNSLFGSGDQQSGGGGGALNYLLTALSKGGQYGYNAITDLLGGSAASQAAANSPLYGQEVQQLANALAEWDPAFAQSLLANPAAAESLYTGLAPQTLDELSGVFGGGLDFLAGSAPAAGAEIAPAAASLYEGLAPSTLAEISGAFAPAFAGAAPAASSVGIAPGSAFAGAGAAGAAGAVSPLVGGIATAIPGALFALGSALTASQEKNAQEALINDWATRVANPYIASGYTASGLIPWMQGEYATGSPSNYATGAYDQLVDFIKAQQATQDYAAGRVPGVDPTLAGGLQRLQESYSPAYQAYMQLLQPGFASGDPLAWLQQQINRQEPGIDPGLLAAAREMVPLYIGTGYDYTGSSDQDLVNWYNQLYRGY